MGSTVASIISARAAGLAIRPVVSWVRWLIAAVVVAAIAALVVGVAYQARPPLRLAIGDEVSDKGVVHGFYADERREGDGRRFRWTRGSASIALPAWGAGPYRLAVEMGAPLNPEPIATIVVNGQPVLTARLSGDFQRHEAIIPAELAASGDLIIGIDSPTFSPPNDRRRLGVVVHAVELTPLGTAPVWPPPAALAMTVGLALLALATLAVAGWGTRAAATGALTLTLAVGALLVGARLLIVPVLGELLGLGLLALGVTVVLRLGLAAANHWLGWRVPAGEQRWLLTIVAAALLIRLAATLHPQMDVIDIGFHVNRFTDVAERGQLFLKIRSAEWGGRETVYSPAAYIAMLPLSWLIDDTHRMVRFFTALLETSRALLVFALARWVSERGRAALLATLLFVSLPLAVLPFSWGITSNLFGEWWATALLLALTIAWRDLHRPRALAVATALALLALLAHPGDLLLTGAFLALLTLGLAGRALWRRGDLAAGHSRRAGAVALVALVASLLAFGLFYRVDAPAMLAQGAATLSGRLSGESATDAPRRWRVSGSVDDKSLGMGAAYVTSLAEVPLAGVRGFAREAWAYYWGWPLLAAAAGWVALGGSERGRAFRRLSATWVATAALFALVGLLLNLYVRYSLFLLPVVATLAGVALDRLAARGRWGVMATSLLMMATVVAGLWLWHQRVVVFFH